jgi:ABC-type multidrug transport system ATPase subunit
MSAIIQVTALSKQFGNIKAVEDLSFSVDEGDVYGFLGQNGAGKSTTIRMLLTLIKPSSGSIRIFGKDLEKERKSILNQVGAVIERPDLYKYLSAYENISLFAKMTGTKISREKLMRQLDQVGLSDRADSKVGTYSLGMKQRLGIAIALVNNPQLVLLDEPTNGLDPQGIADIRNLILFLSRTEKKTVLVSSHLLSEIELIANRMLIIDKGKKIVEGAVQTLFDPAQTLLELQTVDPSSTIELLQQSVYSNLIQKQVSGVIVLKMHRNDIPSLNRFLVQHAVEVLSLEPRHSLEDYFLSLTSANQHVETFAN